MQDEQSTTLIDCVLEWEKIYNLLSFFYAFF
jgi:hypothetical protein